MKISAQQSETISQIETAIKSADPVFHNYKDGVYSFQVKSDVSSIQIADLKVVSCKPHNDGFVVKYK